MEEILKIAVISIISVILALIVAEKTPFLSICIVLAVSTIILGISLEQLKILLENLNDLIKKSGISLEYFQPVMKVCAIAVIVKISGDICKDAGYSAVSQKIQFAGSVSSIVAVFPLFLKIIELLQDIL